MADRLKGKIAIVVGAGSIGPGWGNGKATAVTFAREGAKVLCVDVNPAAAEETVGIIRSEGGEARNFQAEVTRSAEVKAMVEACLQTYGRVDVLDNNVGVAAEGGVVEVSEEEWDRVMAINLKSCFLAMKHVIPVMERQGGGSIINISSVAGIRYTGVPYATYYASKSAMNHLTRTTAVQYAPKKIRVNAVLPGLMETPMVVKSPASRRPTAARRSFGKRGRGRCPWASGEMPGTSPTRALPRERREPLRHGPRARRRRRHHAEIRVREPSVGCCMHRQK
jgi:NAD(P)-dependent dehydrogenase (short-subunit alcohol dehydrogenase family)